MVKLFKLRFFFIGFEVLFNLSFFSWFNWVSKFFIWRIQVWNHYFLQKIYDFLPIFWISPFFRGKWPKSCEAYYCSLLGCISAIFRDFQKSSENRHFSIPKLSNFILLCKTCPYFTQFPTKFPLSQFFSSLIRFFIFAYFSANDAKYAKIIAKEKAETFTKWFADAQRTLSLYQFLASYSPSSVWRHSV